MRNAEGIRNIGILAHVDAGKTTLTERMLYLSGEIRAPGSVDDGTAHTDRLDVERERGISVRAASVSFQWGGARVNLIDTPGHRDFAAEVERTLLALDGAVFVVPASEGVQAQAEALWQALKQLGIPTLVFVSKLDLVSADEENALAELRGRLSPRMLPLQTVRRRGEGYEIKPLWEYGSDAAAPEDAVEAVASADDGLLEAYVAGGAVSCRDVDAAVARATAARALFPVLYGAAARGDGVAALLDAVVRYLPEPAAGPGDAPSGVVFRVEHDKTMGRVAHVRLFAGSVKNRDAVPVGGRPAGKVTQVRRMSAGRWRDVGEVGAGDIAALCGLTDARVGDVLGEAELALRNAGLAVPLLRVRALPAAEADFPRLLEALGELAEEDPALNLQWLRDERELHLSVMGGIQLEVLESLLMSRWGLAVSFGTPAVIYRETPAKRGRGHVSYTMPKPCWAVLDFDIEPGPRGSGLRYASVVRDDRIFYRYQEHVRKTVPEALKQGLYGWEVTDLSVTLTGGEHHIVHTHPMDFFTATPMGIMDGLKNCGTTLLEPMLWVRLTAPEAYGGRLIRDVLDMRGSFDAPAAASGLFVMEALVPVATSLEYPARLGAATGGRGAMTARFAGYRECPLELGATTPYRGVNPLDREKYILKVRGAIK